MQTQTKKYRMLAIILLGIAILSVAVSSLAVSYMQEVSKSAISKLNATSEDKAPIEIIGEMKVSHSDVGPEGLEITKFTNTRLAMADGKELYCVNHGIQFYHPDTDILRISTALGYGRLDGSTKIWPRTHSSCRFQNDTNIRENRSDDLYTLPYLQCIGRHYNLLDKEGGEYHPDVAYILTYPQLGQWSEEKQNAIWCTAFSNARSPVKTGTGEGVKIYEEALKFRDFSDKTTSVAGAGQTQPNITPSNQTNMNTMQISPNYNEQTYILGPFSIDYINGIYENVAFGGISDMYFIGLNKDGRKIKDRIEIETYIYDGKEYRLQYFEPEMSDGSYVDKTAQVYPKGRSAGEEKFYLKIKNPNKGINQTSQIVNGVILHIDFKWMGVTQANICELDAHKYQVHGSDSHSWHCHGHRNGYCSGCCYYCTWSTYLEEKDIQDHINVLEAQRKLFKASLEIPEKVEQIELHLENSIKMPMELGGHVWEDTTAGKESIAEGYSNTVDEENNLIDIPLKNVKVTLYSCKPGAKIGNGEIEKIPVPENVSDEDVIHYVNPTYTDAEGNYLFKNIDPLKKYYVTFEYNGQVYLPTEYLTTGETHQDENGQTVIEHYNNVNQMVNRGLYNTTKWEITSKGTEVPQEIKVKGQEIKDRETYNKQFEEIRSYPENYATSNSLARSGKYNTTFTMKDLMGYTLDNNGHYVQKGLQLVDGFLYDENGAETKTFSEGEISKRVREYIKRYHAFPDDNAMKNEIYSSIARNDEQIWRKLQFIEDCKISSYTQAQGGSLDLYPVYDAFTYSSKQTYENYRLGLSIYITETITVEGIDYELIYPGQYYINQGLWRRQKNDLALKKDVYRVAVKINGKTEIYQYNKREGNGDSDENWQIHLRMQDYENYYGGNYNRELFLSDYEYKGENGGVPLEIYVTYQITVRNSSQGILNQVTEVVDYYDKDYIYMPNLSWVMYKDSSEENSKKVAVPQASYYNMMHNLDLSQIENARAINSNPDSSTIENGSSRYGASTQQDMEKEYNSVYVRGLENKKLVTGESEYIYLTFKVKSDEKGPVILDDANSFKMNYAEINGYTNYYTDGTRLPNDQVISGNNTPAGLIDYNSNPGNLELDDLKGEKYEKNFENDTDRAKGLGIIIDENSIRKMNGIVWEDQRTQNVNDAVIGDGMRNNGEIGVQGVKVELVEKLANGNEYVWDRLTASTGEAGSYEIKGYIPGDYVVRFTYGNNDQTVLTKPNGGQNAVSYNGQDFKSTIYLKEVSTGKELAEKEGYYDIEEADKNTASGQNFSDAKDRWEDREKVNNYSNNNGNGVTNGLAEVLASPYANTMDQAKIDELKQNTAMRADTAIIVAEVEYNRQNTGNIDAINGTYFNDNDKNGIYVLHNIDLGITERPKAQLEIGKKVSNLKITLANGSILFDASKSNNTVLWIEGKPYNLSSKMEKEKYKEYYEESKKDANYNRYSYRTEIDKLIASNFSSGSNGLVQPSIDDELIHGANIEISYELTVTNVGETDYNSQEFYYKANGATENNKVTTSSNEVLDYVANNLQYKAENNQGWNLATISNLTNNDANRVNERLVNNSLAEKLTQFNTIIQTSNLNANLKPGEKAKTDLVLSQLLTAQNTEDDRRYNNIVEIVKTTNTVGRRMAYSIVGNQDPTANPSEVDSAKSEEVSVVPPFGDNVYVYLAIGTVAIILLAFGIVIIKKVVIGDRHN